MSDQWYVLGYPRSGNSWVRYILRACAGLPLVHAHAQSDNFTKIHWRDSDIDTSRGLVLVVRNYKEAILRHNLINHQSTESGPQWSWDYIFEHSWESFKTVDPVVSYLHPLLIHHGWKRPKYIVYYEELIHSDAEAIVRLCNYVGLPYDTFIDKLDYHRELCLEDYRESQSDGKTAIQYSASVSLDHRQEWDRWVKNRSPIIYRKYLGRYDESNRTSG